MKIDSTYEKVLLGVKVLMAVATGYDTLVAASLESNLTVTGGVTIIPWMYPVLAVLSVEGIFLVMWYGLVYVDTPAQNRRKPFIAVGLAVMTGFIIALGWSVHSGLIPTMMRVFLVILVARDIYGYVTDVAGQTFKRFLTTFFTVRDRYLQWRLDAERVRDRQMQRAKIKALKALKKDQERQVQEGLEKILEQDVQKALEAIPVKALSASEGNKLERTEAVNPGDQEKVLPFQEGEVIKATDIQERLDVSMSTAYAQLNRAKDAGQVVPTKNRGKYQVVN